MTSMTSSARTKSKVLTGKLALGILGVLVLLAFSLFTGVYDIFGKDDGAMMFAVTRHSAHHCAGAGRGRHGHERIGDVPSC